MYLTRSLPVTLEAIFSEKQGLEAEIESLKRRHPNGTVVSVAQKELMKLEARDSTQSNSTLFTRNSKNSELVPLREVSELISSSAWRRPQFRLIVTESLYDSALARDLNSKISLLGFGRKGQTVRQHARTQKAART